MCTKINRDKKKNVSFQKKILIAYKDFLTIEDMMYFTEQGYDATRNKKDSIIKCNGGKKLCPYPIPTDLVLDYFGINRSNLEKGAMMEKKLGMPIE